MKQPGFCDVDERLARLSRLGDQLEAFSRTVDFEAFRPDLEKAWPIQMAAKAVVPRLIRC
ncbi:transposase [Gluconobacter thailandicus]|nr:transposase [Gluconobacter thailandicus]